MFSRTDLGSPDLQSLFNASPNPYVLMDAELRIVGANAAYLRVTARSLDDIVGRVVFDAFPSDPSSVHGQQLRQSLARVLRTGEPEHIAAIRYPIVDEHGRLGERVWSATHIPLANAAGQVTHVLQHTEDITHLEQLRKLARGNDPALTAGILRRAEASQETIRVLANERQYLRGIFDQAPGFAAVTRGPDHVFELVNAAYLSLVGQRELIGLSARQGLPELAGQGLFEMLDKVYASGEAHVGHAVALRLQRGAGEAGPELRHVDFVAQPLRDADGRVNGIFVQGQDLTAQMDAERRAEISQRRFDTLVDTLPLQVWSARPDGRASWSNDRLASYAGVAPNGPAVNWLDLVCDEDRDSTVAAWQQALALGQELVMERRLRRHDGVLRWHLVHASPVRDAQGRISQWVGSNTDIDDQKAATVLLSDLNNELARRVDERSAELMRAQEALRHAQQLEAVGSLAGGIAHEFNNLLQVIGGNLDLLKTSLPDEPAAQQRFERARRAVQRGAGLAGQLLAYGRRQALQPENIDLARLIETLHEVLARTLGEGVSINTVVASDLWPTLVDAGMVEHALLNLALNARDAMAGRGHLTIEATNAVLESGYTAQHEDVQPGEYVVLTVTDTGCGMPPDVQARAFEPFFTTKARGQGSGLGLSMVFGFAKQSGGHVKLYSEPDHGTSVRLYLPRSATAPAAPDLQAAAADSSLPVPQLPLSLLVVEDDEALRATVVEQLQALGHSVHQAGDAAQTLALLQSGLAVDVLFTDVVMPGELNGIELAQRAQRLRPRLQVLFTSGYPENALVQGGRVQIGTRLLGKPYSRETLVRALTAFAPRPPGPSSLAPGSAALRVLLCEDDDLVRDSLDELLTLLDCQVLCTQTLADARRVLQPAEGMPVAASAPFDLLITDLQLPDGSGLDLAHEARAWWPELGLVFASGQGGRHAASQFPDAHHLEKPFGFEELELLLRHLRDARSAGRQG